MLETLLIALRRLSDVSISLFALLGCFVGRSLKIRLLEPKTTFITSSLEQLYCFYVLRLRNLTFLAFLTKVLQSRHCCLSLERTDSQDSHMIKVKILILENHH